MEVILHIGMHKTATTSVQEWLRRNTVALEARSIRAFPLDQKVLAYNPRLFDPAGLGSQLARSERDGMKCVIFSNEGMSVAGAEGFRRLYAALGDRPTRVVVTFRHWIGFLPARWRQNCQRRDAMSFPAFMERLRREADQHFNMRLDSVIGAAVVGRNVDLRIIGYDAARSTKGVVHAVLEACDVPQDMLLADPPDSIRSNESRRKTDLDMLRLFNGIYADHVGEPANVIFDAMRDHRPVQRMYDLNFGSMIKPLLDSNACIRNKIGSLMNDRMMCVHMRRSDFIHYEKKLMDTIKIYDKKCSSEEFFGNVDDAVVKCSSLEYTDVPIDLREKMAQALLAQMAPRSGWRARLGKWTGLRW